MRFASLAKQCLRRLSCMLLFLLMLASVRLCGAASGPVDSIQSLPTVVDFFTSFEWWKTNPHHELVDGGNDRHPRPALGGVPAACGHGDCPSGAGNLSRGSSMPATAEGFPLPRMLPARHGRLPNRPTIRSGAPPGIALCCFRANKGCRAAYNSFLSGLRTWSRKRGCAAPQRA